MRRDIQQCQIEDDFACSEIDPAFVATYNDADYTDALLADSPLSEFIVLNCQDATPCTRPGPNGIHEKPATSTELTRSVDEVTQTTNGSCSIRSEHTKGTQQQNVDTQSRDAEFRYIRNERRPSFVEVTPVDVRRHKTRTRRMDDHAHSHNIWATPSLQRKTPMAWWPEDESSSGFLGLGAESLTKHKSNKDGHQEPNEETNEWSEAFYE
jgi:hypothetical protein